MSFIEMDCSDKYFSNSGGHIRKSIYTLYICICCMHSMHVCTTKTVYATAVTAAVYTHMCVHTVMINLKYVLPFPKTKQM